MKPEPLHLEDYRSAINLSQPFCAPSSTPLSEDERTRAVDSLLAHLQAEGTPATQESSTRPSPHTFTDKRRLLQALLTVRGPDPLPDWFHEQLDRLLQYERSQCQIRRADSLPRIAKAFPKTRYSAAAHTALWQGDITSLQVDALVNAANHQMLGCFQPFHACIDNVIHNAAGPRLREDCGTIMNLQGHPEETGWAKITRGYHLPAKFVLHTVGPIIPKGQAHISHQQAEQLACCYLACLDLVSKLPEIRSLAFCCISTGVFGFPQETAAQIALYTVAAWMLAHESALDLVVFDVYTDIDRMIYQQKLSS